MTDRKAIKMLKGFLLITSIAEIEDEEEKEEIGETFQTAISALEERQERKKGCGYCSYETVPEDEWSDGTFSGIVGNTEYLGCYDDAYYNNTRKLHFCPMCGKLLKEDG